MKDYRIKISIRNDRLLSAIEKAGYKSARQFALHNAMEPEKVCRIIRGAEKPIDKHGNITKICSEILSLLNKTLKECFTDRQLEGFKNTTFETKIEEKDLKKLINPIKSHEVKVIEKDVQLSLNEIFSKYLTAREEKILRMRFGIGLNTNHTYEEIGLEFSLARERIRQIEKRALGKLKHPNIINKLISTGFNDIFTKVDVKPEQLKRCEQYEDINKYNQTKEQEKCM
jgi:RNA polymerase sigma factor (sigma-70 family)